MLIVQDKLVSDDIIEEHFLCNLKVCKGACCWEGDYGAPLANSERQILEEILPKLQPYLSAENWELINQKGTAIYYEDAEDYGTPLMKNGACVYMTYDNAGIAQCGIEQAYNDGITTFKKPISCHLYPIRVTQEPGFEALNYDRWDICNAACSLGKKEQLPLYKFLKEPIIRQYGQNFYDELDKLVTMK